MSKLLLEKSLKEKTENTTPDITPRIFSPTESVRLRIKEKELESAPPAKTVIQDATIAES